MEPSGGQMRESSSAAAQAGWYPAQGDPPGTLRYWNGDEWVGEPVAGGAVAAPGTVASEVPAVEWSVRGLAQPTHEYASWGLRVAAWLIDVGLVIPLATGSIMAFSAPGESGDGLVTIGFVLLLAAFVVPIVNSIIVHGLTGQTVGKRVMKTMLVTYADTKRPGIWRVIGRGLLAVVAGNLTAGIFTLVDLLWPLWDDKNQRIADKVVSTVVIVKPKH